MDFMTVDQINVKLINLVRNERKLTEEILNHIILFQKSGGFLKLGYSTMHQYMTRTLGYSDDQAYRRFKAAKLLQDVPEVADQLKSGEIKLSQAAQTQQAIETSQKETKNPVSIEKKKKIIKAINKSNNFETKKTLASELNLKPKLDEKSIPQSNKTVRLELNLSAEQFEKLKTIKSLLSHKIPSQNTAEVLEVLFDHYLHKNPFTTKSKEYNNSTNQTMKPKKYGNPTTPTAKFKTHCNSTIQTTEQSTSKSTSTMNQTCNESQSTITESFMENRDFLKSKNEEDELIPIVSTSNLNRNLNFDSNINADSSLKIISTSNSDNRRQESLKHQKLKPNNHQSLFKRTRYIPIPIRRKIFQRANYCCEFTAPNQVHCQSRFQLEIDHFVIPYSQGGDHSLDNLKLHCSQHNLYRASSIGIGFETIKSCF